ncbi:hypothetical protein [Candidatus Absconditicoccus praedator]|uniref:hypothetical protein n=1 Tax=Candidatus Absconditicoccus praedator TaxID=2735562 RepID=UPI001E572BCD|nr:hypothetical protein [Candidatus Absconditicoccus praedator]UFX83228.1 hypothetical protein HLG78_03810 [Candidatus Absconditicoccus praedator]
MMKFILIGVIFVVFLSFSEGKVGEYVEKLNIDEHLQFVGNTFNEQWGNLQESIDEGSFWAKSSEEKEEMQEKTSSGVGAYNTFTKIEKQLAKEIDGIDYDDELNMYDLIKMEKDISKKLDGISFDEEKNIENFYQILDQVDESYDEKSINNLESIIEEAMD